MYFIDCLHIFAATVMSAFPWRGCVPVRGTTL